MVNLLSDDTANFVSLPKDVIIFSVQFRTLLLNRNMKVFVDGGAVDLTSTVKQSVAKKQLLGRSNPCMGSCRGESVRAHSRRFFRRHRPRCYFGCGKSSKRHLPKELCLLS